MPTPPQTLSARLREHGERYNSGKTFCGQAFAASWKREDWNVPHCDRCEIAEEDHAMLEAAAELDRHDALVTAAEAWAQAMRDYRKHGGAMAKQWPPTDALLSADNALLALLPPLDTTEPTKEKV